MDAMGTALTFISLALAGAFVGVCSGLLGVGGGTLMVPLLRLAFGAGAHVAAATSLFTIVFTSLSGAAAHLRNRTCLPKLGVALGLGGCLTSALGVYLGSISPAWAIVLAASAIIFYSAFTMLRKALKLPGGSATATRGQGPARQPDDPSKTTGEAFDPSPRKLAAGFGIGLIAGLAAGYAGIGGGFIMVPLMTSLLGVPMKKASGTSIIAIIILSVPGVASQMMLGNVDYFAGIVLAAGSVPGAMLGAWLVRFVNERQLRFLFAGFLAVAGFLLIANELGLLA